MHSPYPINSPAFSPAASPVVTSKTPKTFHRSELVVEDGEELPQHFAFDHEPFSLWSELSQMWGLIWPVTLATIFRLTMYNTDSAFVGRLGTNDLAGVTLAEVWIQCITTFVYGPAYVLNTVCSQAIGAKNPKLAGNWLQLSLAICTILAAIVVVFFIYTGSIVGLVEKNHHVTNDAQLFARYATLVLLPTALYMSVRQYFQAMQIVLPATVVSAIAILLNMGFNQLFIHGYHFSFAKWDGLGLIGSPIATATSLTAQLCIFYMYACVWKKYHIEYWGGWSRESFRWTRVKEFLKLALPMTIGAAVENWGFQLVTILSGRFAPYETASMTILFSVWGVLWAFFWGLGLAIMIRVGHLLGAGSVIGAKQTTKMAVALVFLITIVVSTVVILTRNYIGLIFSHDENIVRLVGELIPSLAILFTIGSLGWAGASVLDGMGRNVICAVVYAVTTWLFYVPGAIYTAFFMGVKCPICWIWYAGIASEAIRVVIIWVIVWRTDWYEMSRKARERSEAKETGEEKDKGDPLLGNATYDEEGSQRRKKTTMVLEENDFGYTAIPKDDVVEKPPET